MEFVNIFADDVVIYVTGKDLTNITESLQTNVDAISKWYENNRLCINISKTKTMLIKSRSSDTLRHFQMVAADFNFFQILPAHL